MMMVVMVIVIVITIVVVGKNMAVVLAPGVFEAIREDGGCQVGGREERAEGKRAETDFLGCPKVLMVANAAIWKRGRTQRRWPRCCRVLLSHMLEDQGALSNRRGVSYEQKI